MSFKPSNSLALVDRELISGSIEGVNFGPSLILIARAPDRALFWNGGHSYTSGRRTEYAAATLTSIPRSVRFGSHPRWANHGEEGGRLTPGRVAASVFSLARFFDDNELAAIVEAVRQKKTCIIEGGGARFAPSRKVPGYIQEYQRWRIERYGK